MTEYESKINKAVTHEANRKVLIDFMKYSIGTGKGKRRLNRYYCVLVSLSNSMGKDYKDITAEDLQKFVCGYFEDNSQRGRKFSAWTQYSYQVVLKLFFRWLHKTEKPLYPVVCKWMQPKRPKANYKTSEELITEDEALKLIRAADNPRDKCFMSLMFESGARISELLGLRIMDVEFTEGITFCSFNAKTYGKTGFRKVPIVNSGQYLSAWLSTHPFQANKEAPVFCVRSEARSPSYTAIRKTINRIAKRAEINKPMNPHHFRHSQCTILAGKLTEQQLKVYAGWTGSSSMAGTYVHLNGKSISDAVMQARGIKKPETVEESKLKPKNCGRCGTINFADAGICSKCGAALTIEAALEHEKQTACIMDAIERREDLKKELLAEMTKIIREEMAAKYSV